ncbi:MBL fold metallo-hydrolase [Croceitalea rosinachiae]|uniref:MBL fold metallo-hydrolase n=1 Tax=Croceitalea rosinachiae TaxID=3075596 RepID=A0ABU3AD48_9FLAO|nr:MBL fold metallo-hydrolase [Croceitalea sp. F388]MDT0608106.1 MBL fold metallo-hydrolase [Croceitalea sp. F388]
MKVFFNIILFFAFVTCQSQTNPKVSLVVLGTVQDGGSPHIGCRRDCCIELFKNPDPTRKVVSLGVIDHENDKTFLFEATPNITSQLKLLKEIGQKETEIPDGIFLTHAHIGHYTGLMYLGREALGSNSTPVYVMPKMKGFLETNGPWSQLVLLKNINLHQIKNENEIALTNNLSVVPFTVPHRDEFSETVGYKIIGPNKVVLFIPDIDKWSKWEKSILEEIKKVDLAFLDASFFDGKEIKNRDISEIPHPFVIESMALFKSLSNSEKKKVHFIHFNHTNPLLNPKSKEANQVLQNGFNFSNFKDVIRL